MPATHARGVCTEGKDAGFDSSKAKAPLVGPPRLTPPYHPEATGPLKNAINVIEQYTHHSISSIFVFLFSSVTIPPLSLLS